MPTLILWSRRMNDGVLARVAALKSQPIANLMQQWRDLFETEPPPYNRRFLTHRHQRRRRQAASANPHSFSKQHHTARCASALYQTTHVAARRTGTGGALARTTYFATMPVRRGDVVVFGLCNVRGEMEQRGVAAKSREVGHQSISSAFFLTLSCVPPRDRKSPHLRRIVAADSGLVEGVGFEPTIRFPVYTLSKRAPSATRPSLRADS